MNKSITLVFLCNPSLQLALPTLHQAATYLLSVAID